MGGRITVESVVRCSWNGWPDDRGIRMNAAWTYPAPTPDAEGIRDYIAFWKGVDVA
ncbi:DUF427 domain-containing protein [Pseudomonas sp. FeN3W]|nr:DUF427 domain-containing protein [Pseudomonas sp. FeN3W]